MSPLSTVLVWEYKTVVWFPPHYFFFPFFPVYLCMCAYICGHFKTYAQAEMVFKNFYLQELM